ncbi:membrane protein insertion efficiency factor YidD [Candidatus Shapirobacteria bacterium CG07_land_8_20_14_0_80_39_18]|uniref:Putative membrane protein insertion efficiency factor n=1 Tax=Candidatus Shapirobacteria bacterium CG07_land_8_20_14_0_80_39_18 TaxID=1974882 RepID=A0A2M6YRF0_9BACT|nr:MAG: membrane protein insertion efficiency factor YidD [Candidatus Shapirobacteria bacterium CG07_land_8_20_14_0_80_39_18]
MRKLVLGLIRFYQKYLSFDSGFLRTLFLTDKACRFTPSCSEYTYQAISKYGIILGGWKGVRRILKCNPWNSGGDDPLQ